MARGDIPPAILVFPNGLAESMWTNAKDGRVPMETVVVRDLLNHVDATFRTVARRDGRVLEGFSMGGRGSGRLGFRYPELFATISMLGAGPLDADFMGPMAQSSPVQRARILQAVWGNDLNFYRADGPAAIAAAQQAVLRGEMRPRIRIAVGETDFVLADNRDLNAQLNALQIGHDFIVVPGVGHQALPLLTGLGAVGWAFYREGLGGSGG
jgi:enterochelin esterase-like enzyme